MLLADQWLKRSSLTVCADRKCKIVNARVTTGLGKSVTVI